jgi:hypothetical protein
MRSTGMSDTWPPEGIGWRVLDPEGNVLASGPVVIAEMVAGILEESTPKEG